MHRTLDVFWLDKDNATSLGVDVQKSTQNTLRGNDKGNEGHIKGNKGNKGYDNVTIKIKNSWFLVGGEMTQIL